MPSHGLRAQGFNSATPGKDLGLALDSSRPLAYVQYGSNWQLSNSVAVVILDLILHNLNCPMYTIFLRPSKQYHICSQTAQGR